MLPFFAAMGLNYDKDSFNFDKLADINQNRPYKTSQIDPMNTNIAFVLFKCSKGKKTKSPADYKVRAFQNENLIKVNGCKI